METKDKFAGEYMSIDTTKDGDTAIIMDEGEETEIENKWTHKMEWKLNLAVKIGSVSLIWTPWSSDGRMLQKAWGTDTNNWIGKKLSIFHMKNKMIVRIAHEEEPNGEESS